MLAFRRIFVSQSSSEMRMKLRDGRRTTVVNARSDGRRFSSLLHGGMTHAAGLNTKRIGLISAVCFLANVMAAFLVSPAHGDVIEIAPSGSLTVYGVPSVFTAEGVRPISRPSPVAMRHVPAPSSAQRSVGTLLSAAADRYEIRAGLLQSVAWHESRFHNEAVSSKGAVGVMQLMAGTARELGVDRYNLSENILGGAQYLKQMLDRFGGNEALALAAYNAGPGAVDRAGGIPQFNETKNYVSAILGPFPPIQAASPSVLFIDR